MTAGKTQHVKFIVFKLPATIFAFACYQILVETSATKTISLFFFFFFLQGFNWFTVVGPASQTNRRCLQMSGSQRGKQMYKA